MNLILIETSGNQNYVFATNKLRENVGASELTFSIGTKIALLAVELVTTEENAKDTNKQIIKLWQEDKSNDASSGKDLREALRDVNRNPPLEDRKAAIEVVIATSGKAILLVESCKIGKRVISEVTAHAAREMPGLTIHGAISHDFDLSGGVAGVHKQVGEVHKKLETVRYAMPNNHGRFLRLPFVAPCRTSGLPANKYADKDIKAERGERSVVADSKRKASKQGQLRLGKFIEPFAPDVRLIKNINYLEKRFDNLDWLAVIHADGNGLGEIFLNFDKCCNAASGREYINQYRAFSLELDECTLGATASALKNLQQRYLVELEEGREKEAERLAATLNRVADADAANEANQQSNVALDARDQSPKSDPKEVPVIPLVFGGDDLSVICDGRYAIKFTHDFLCEFERLTANNDVIKAIAGKAFGGVKRLSICAGVAIVKPHFPFHTAYELAESLLKSAKKVKEKVLHTPTGDAANNETMLNTKGEKQLPCSALDYHILYDSSGANLEAIRAKLHPELATRLYARPYVVTDESGLKTAKENSKTWFAPRLWNELETRVAAMLARDGTGEKRRKLPNSQLHDLRESLFLGRTEANARANLVAHRYATQGFNHLFKNDSLFFPHESDASEYATNFLDALDITEFRKGEKVAGGKLVDKQSLVENAANNLHNGNGQ